LAEKASKEPLPVGAAITDRDMKPRAVILGDYLPITNGGVDTWSENYDFFRSYAEWLVNRNLSEIGVRPNETGVYKISEEVNKPRLILLPLGLTVLALAGMGTGVWIVRRK
jgi:hypothetical protein